LTVTDSIIPIPASVKRHGFCDFENKIGKLPTISVTMHTHATDTALLAILRENARLPTSEIARRLRLSRTTVQSRIDRLERSGVIRGYTVRIRSGYEQHHLRAQIMISVRPRQMTPVVNALRAMPEVRALHSVSGPYDLIALGITQASEDMDMLTDRIGLIDGVERTTSAIILSTKFERG